MSQNLARTILDEQLATVVNLPAHQKENVRFAPTANEPWCRSTLLPGQTVPESLGVNGTNQLKGLYQVDLFYPAGKGTSTSGAMADAVLAAFGRGTQLTADEMTIHVEMAWQDVGQHIDGIYQVPVVVRWRSSVNS